MSTPFPLRIALIHAFLGKLVVVHHRPIPRLLVFPIRREPFPPVALLVGVAESPPEFVFAILVSSDGTAGWIRIAEEERGLNLCSEEGAKVLGLSLLVFVASLMPGIDILHGIPTDMPDVGIDAFSISWSWCGAFTLGWVFAVGGKVCGTHIWEVRRYC